MQFRDCERIRNCERLPEILAKVLAKAMPPARSDKRKAPPPRAAAAAPGEQPANAERGLQPGLVKEFLEMIQRRDRLGPEFLNDDERRQWDEYLDSVPASAEESADGKSLFPVQMPAKCKPRASASGAGSSTSRSQQEIITYSNAGGRQFHAGDRQRQHAASKPMRAADVPVGSTVAIRKEASSVGCQPGYGTPFDVGDVVGADIDAHGVVQKLSIHFRMPQGADGLFVDDMKKPWNLACHALHTYHKSCERGIACRAAAQKAGSQVSKFMYTCDAKEVFETKLELNDSKTLKAETKKRLAESAPEEGGWNALLGIASNKRKAVGGAGGP